MKRRTVIATSVGAAVSVWLVLWPVSCDGMRLSNPPIPLVCTSLTGLRVPWWVALAAGVTAGGLVGLVLWVAAVRVRRGRAPATRDERA